jgi:hypothetical protein
MIISYRDLPSPNMKSMLPYKGKVILALKGMCPHMHAPLDAHAMCVDRDFLSPTAHASQCASMVMHVRAHALEGKFFEFLNSCLFSNLC